MVKTNSKSNHKKKLGGAGLLIYSSLYFAFQFKDADSNNAIFGLVACGVLLVIAIYSIYRTLNKS